MRCIFTNRTTGIGCFSIGIALYPGNDILSYWYQSYHCSLWTGLWSTGYYHWYQWIIGLTNRIRLCILDMCALKGLFNVFLTCKGKNIAFPSSIPSTQCCAAVRATCRKEQTPQWNGGDRGGVWILLFSWVILFEYNVSTILLAIVGYYIRVTELFSIFTWDKAVSSDLCWRQYSRLRRSHTATSSRNRSQIFEQKRGCSQSRTLWFCCLRERSTRENCSLRSLGLADTSFDENWCLSSFRGPHLILDLSHNEIGDAGASSNLSRLSVKTPSPWFSWYWE